MIAKILGIFKVLLGINFIQQYKRYKGILRALAGMTKNTVDNKFLKYLDNLLLNNTEKLTQEQKKAIAKKLNRNHSVIPQVGVDWTEKSGFKVSLKANI